MENEVNFITCKVCNQETAYTPADIQIDEHGEFFIFCEHCMNNIYIKR